MARKHRTREQWQQLIAQWQDTGGNAQAFCSKHEIGYASFCKWRKRLQQPESQPREDAQFMDVSALQQSADRWDIVLSLGHGVELKLSQR
ncbi:IS66 family insertion sequence element accessory protein TnpA [Aliidiomarina maris]|uniref:Transposase n=1 Tax=Aliidiomarina maris TaxID=531312 RepID=A0ABY0BNE9_9GAMM|nr:hypothetical protein [Aliidiomarina maris]RUO18066.1 IS66 family insertion sequence hypothetical protein [Aliidiomarina maris]